MRRSSLVLNSYTTKDVRNAILQAGISLGWQMDDVRPGLIMATLNVRDHMAQVEIPYDRHTYSILYRDSVNLGYNGSSIHSNYTGCATTQRGDQFVLEYAMSHRSPPVEMSC